MMNPCITPTESEDKERSESVGQILRNDPTQYEEKLYQELPKYQLNSTVITYIDFANIWA